jgi:hypothetical protein
VFASAPDRINVPVIRRGQPDFADGMVEDITTPLSRIE